MPKTDKKHRPYLRDYIDRTGRRVEGTRHSVKIVCPAHADGNASCQINDETLHCYGCGFQGDIYDLAGLDQNLKTFREQSDYLDSFFGSSPPPPTERPEPRQPTRGRPISIHPDKAKTTFSRGAIQKIADLMKLKGEPEEPIFYKDKFGKVDAADVRFIDGDSKQVITFWWNGRNVKASTPPLLLWGRDLLAQQPELPVLIVEGAKCAEAARVIPEMVPVSWMRGIECAGKTDWSILENRQVFIYPDDDDPGRSAANQIKLKLPQAVIVEPLESAREIKSKGADIVEALQVKTPEALAHYILNFKPAEPDGPVKGEWKPFTILGTADDGLLYCVDRHGRLRAYDPASLSKTKLMTLADLLFWEEHYPKKGGFAVDEAIDDLIKGGSPDFDPDRVRGRGAWREKNGDICYHDGKQTVGKPSEKRMYIKKVQKDIGVNGPEISSAVIERVRDIALQFTFKSSVDACRLLAHAALDPFGGSLLWRPALLITGESGSGKSTIVDLIKRPLAAGLVFTGGGSTEPGIRQAVGNDSYPVLLEEAEGDTQTKRQNRENLFSLMRQSTTDDAPQIAKGTSGEQRGTRFTMKSQFTFVSIDPQIEFSADDNRIFRIEMVKADKSREDEFSALDKELRGLLNEDNCRGIRALTFSKLNQIEKTAKEIAHICRDLSGRDMRFGFADGQLWATYWHVWEGREDVTDEFAREFLAHVYGAKPEEPRRNDAGEMVSRIMDQIMEITGDSRKRMTIREACMYIRDGEFEGHDIGLAMTAEVLSSLSHKGIRVLESGDVAFATRHHELQRILEGGTDYARSLARHPGVKNAAQRVRLNGAQKICVVIGGVLEENEKPEQVQLDVPDPTGREY
jgi:hypothetical protein